MTLTFDEARSLLERCRQGDVREPVFVMRCLKETYSAASGDEREVLNRVLRHWLLSGSPADRWDALFLTDEFHIHENVDALRRLTQKLAGQTDPGAPYELERADRIIRNMNPSAPP